MAEPPLAAWMNPGGEATAIEQVAVATSRWHDVGCARAADAQSLALRMANAPGAG